MNGSVQDKSLAAGTMILSVSLSGSHDQFHFYIGITADTFSADLDF